MVSVVEVILYAKICSILETKFGDDPKLPRLLP